MNEDRTSSPRRWPRSLTIAGAIVVLAVGLVVADTLTRPLDVHLRTQIEIFEQKDDGTWEKIDEVGPSTARFDANLLEMARGKKIGSGYVFRAKSKAGEEYTARLADDADVEFNPATGRFDADLAFVVTYAGRSARVLARPSTETRFGPRGAMRGKRADGVLGRGPASFTLVSVNEFRPGDEPSLMLVTEETYRMVPKKGGDRSGR